VEVEKIWYREVITAGVEDTLRSLRESSILDRFYLAGGTALALQFGHRRSVDLDFFSRRDFDPEAIVSRIQRLDGFSVLAKDLQTLHTHITGTKVSFLGYDYPVLFAFEEFLGVNVADPRDIACMKVSAVAGRGTKRDFVDLYFAAKRYGLRHLLDLFGQKFAQANYSAVHLMKSLTYFEEAEKDPMPDMLTATSWQEMKIFLAAEVARLL
jgi:hypothetical protein